MTGAALLKLIGGVRAAVFACLLLVASAFLIWQTVALNRTQAAFDAHLLADKAATATAQEVARATEQAWSEAHYNAVYTLEKQRIKREAKTNSTIAGLRAGTLRVRNRFTCQAVPGAAAPTTGGDDAQGSGLRPEDAEFLVRESDRADDYTEQLAACQAVVTSYRKVLGLSP